MHKVFAVIRREFVERVRTRAFLLTTLLGPLFFGGLIILPALLLSRGNTGVRVAIVDASEGEFGQRVADALGKVTVGRGEKATAKYLVTRIAAGGDSKAVLDSLVPLTGLQEADGAPGFDGILVVDEDGIASGRMQYFGENVASQEDMGSLRSTLTPLVVTERLRRAGVDPTVALRATTPLGLETRKITQGKLTEESGGAVFALAYAMGIILYMALLLYGTQVMTSVIEEKSNRIIEVLVSSLTPFQMMLGKVVGVGLVSLTQISIWAGAAYLLSSNRVAIMSALGIPIPATGGLLPTMNADLLVVFLFFFVLGFLLFSSLYAAVGSMCNTIQDTQQAQFPVLMVVMVGFFSTFALLNDPSSSFAQIAGYIPPLAPFVVPVRYSLAPIPVVQLLLYAATTIIGLLAIVWVSSRIYRVGILMYGKRASVKDVVRWIAAG
ncbi:MAG: ABC transporter permease [Gemmatimonadales bacterium]